MHRFYLSLRRFRILKFICIFTLFLSYAHTNQAGAITDTLMEFNIPAQSLSGALQAFAEQANMQLLYSSGLIEGRQGRALSGRYTVQQALDELLMDSNLGYRLSGVNTITIIEKITIATPEELSEITVEGTPDLMNVGPMSGLNLSLEQFPGNLQRATAEDLRESRALNLADYMRMHMQSMNINDYQGNPYQVDVNYRGFTASPQIGTPQGLSVFFDGIRVNEPFGDVVNWDLIPVNAISTFDVIPGSNPLYGLNTLGGALNIRTKNGIDDPGIESTLQGGSWDRVHGQLSAGGSYGNMGAFIALTGFHEEGWRDNSPSDVRQGFGKLTLRGDMFELNGSMTVAGNDLIGNGLIPKQLYEERPETIFTSPDQTRNNLRQFNLDGILHVTDRFNITAQIYRRDSARRGVNGDIYDDFEDLRNPSDGRDRTIVSGPNPPPSGDPVCRFSDVNNDGVADYVVDINLDSFFLGGFDAFTAPTQALNFPLDEFYEQIFIPTLAPLFPGGETALRTFFPLDGLGATIGNTPLDIGLGLVRFLPLDPATCGSGSDFSIYDFGPLRNGAGAAAPVNPNQSGVVEGTPVGVITDTRIDQITHGAALQFNFNLDKHAFMAGASITASKSAYSSAQQLAIMDETRNVFAASDFIDPVYAAGQRPITINAFDGKSNTLSAYFNETFSPVDNLHLTFSGRYNYTKVKNNLAVRNLTVRDLASFVDLNAGRPNAILCPTMDPASCPTEVNANRSEIFTIPETINPLTFREFVVAQQLALREPEQESFKYHRFNPSIGINYLPKDNINLYANWNQGTRVPSAIELGCAFDPTPVTPPDTNPLDDETPPALPRSLADRSSSCSLPNTLSGDPFLPQVVARTTELGFRVDFDNGWEWDFAAYRSNLFDDMYLVSVQGRDFFQSIGRTRRQGIETGLSGSIGPFDISINYGLNEATFQDRFWIASGGRHVGDRTSTQSFVGSVFNSSADLQLFEGREFTEFGFGTYGLIRVDPGDRIPGMPLHNLSTTINYNATNKWKIGLNMTAHSFSYVRGNENNDHHPGGNDANITESGFVSISPRTRTWKNSGISPGYAVFNMHTSYQINNEFTVFAQVNNVFDHEYTSGGRLGVNPFSPSVNGAIGPSGWNYNSDEWQYDTFIAPGSPRALWVGLELRM